MKTVYPPNLITWTLSGLLLILPCQASRSAAPGLNSTYRAVDAPPVLDKIETSDLIYAKGSGKVIITRTLTVNDIDSRYLWSAVIKIEEGYVNGEDVLSFNNQNQITYSWNPITGVLTLSGRSSVSNYEKALRSVRYENTNTTNPSTQTRKVSFQVRDLLQNSNTVYRNIAFQAVNKPPVLSNIEQTPVIYCFSSQEVPVTATLTVQDPDNSTLVSATVRVSEGYSQDITLTMKNQGDITATWDAASGVLSLTGEGSPGAYQTALRSIRFSKEDPEDPSQQEISIMVSDGEYSSNIISRKVQVNGRVHGVLSGGATICGDDGISVPVQIELSGNPPWNLTLTRNGRNDFSYNNVTSNPFIFIASQEGTYRLKTISDGYCAGDTIGSGYARILTKPRPSAAISGSSTICQLDTADLPVTLTGSAPWSITWLLDGQDPAVVDNIQTGNYRLPVTEEGVYTLSAVRDAFCSGTVSGSATVNVIEVPDVSISGLVSTYNKQSTDLIPIYGTPPGGTFYGPGLIPYDNNWFFVPSLPPAGTHNIVYAYQAAPGACFAYDTFVVRVLEADAIIEFPGDRTRFCRNEAPFTVTGVNLSGITGQFTISGGAGLTDNGDNTATIDPSALQSNEYTLTYTYFDGTQLSFSKDFDVGNPPFTDFNWETECYAPGQPINFNNISYSTTGSISGYLWKIYTDTGFDTASSRDITHVFDSPGNHVVELQVQTSYGCSNTMGKVFSLRPTYRLADSTFYEDFESAPVDWISGTSPTVTVNSWMLGEPSKGFSGAYSGDSCWYTFIPQGSAPKEQSWVAGPCFDFTGTDRPMLKLRIWRLFNSNRDGANLQATTDSGKTWMVVGQLDDGINWFNNYTIRGNPGESSVGWSNVTDAGWIEARHALDMFKGKTGVQFRIAYGSDGTAQGNNGIAFDDFFIGERNRTALVEHFTNASLLLSAEADSILNEMISNDSLNIIDLQYHTSFPDRDPFNDLEPYIPAARVLYYGLSEVPYAILDGGARPVHRFDYIYREPDPTLMHIESLQDSKFEILINSSINGNTLNINTEIVATENMPSRELTVHIVVIEGEITGVTGSNGESVFHSVVKTMLPEAAGTTLYKDWMAGERMTIETSWNMSNVYDPDQLRVVAFIQEENSHEVYQAASRQAGITDGVPDVDAGEREDRFTLFPNPSADLVYIRFYRPVDADLRTELINNVGSLILTGYIYEGERETTMAVRGIPDGLYLLRICQGSRVTGTRKLMIRR